MKLMFNISFTFDSFYFKLMFSSTIQYTVTCYDINDGKMVTLKMKAFPQYPYQLVMIPLFWLLWLLGTYVDCK